MQTFRKIFTICLLLTFSLLLLTPTHADATTKEKYASIVIDSDTGKVLYQRHANSKRYPASLTKIMTLMMAFDAIERGKLSLNQRIPVSAHAASMVPSKLNLPVGSTIRVKDAIRALVTKSANDVAAALGESMGGTESNFARQMTKKARSIGMYKTTFRNASGLHNKRQVTTAKDMSKMARYLIRNYASYYHYFSLQEFKYKGSTYTNHNKLMRTYAGMDGIKTGYVNASGFNLIASAVNDNRRLIGVVFGGRSSKTRNDHMEGLLNASFNKMKVVRIARQAPAPAPQKKPSKRMQTAYLQQALDIDDQQLSTLGEILGEGDIDPRQFTKLETGLLSIAAHTGETISVEGIGYFSRETMDSAPTATNNKQTTITRTVTKANVAPEPSYQAVTASLTPALWQIQVGAFANETTSRRAIQTAKKTLPSQVFTQELTSSVIPLQTRKGAVYRARLGQLNEQEARLACTYIDNCMVIAP